VTFAAIGGERLAWRAGVYDVEAAKRPTAVHNVPLMELKREARLRLDVYAYDLEASIGIALGRASGAAEQVEQSRPGHGASSRAAAASQSPVCSGHGFHRLRCCRLSLNSSQPQPSTIHRQSRTIRL